MNNETVNQPELEVKETAADKRKTEKEEKQRKKNANTMVTRLEAVQISKAIASEEVGHLANFIRDPLRVNMIQTMALVEILLDKGIIADTEEFELYLNRVADRVKKEAEAEMGESIVKEENGSQDSDGEAQKKE